MADEKSEGEVMAEAIGVTAWGYLDGEDKLNALHVQVNPAQQRAIIWVDVREDGLDAQLEVMAAFNEVIDCYEDEYGIELRFGMPQTERVEAMASAHIAAR